MSLKGDADRYGTVAVGLHWLSAAAVLAMLLLGILAAHTPDPGRAAALLRLHVPLGVLVLLLTLARAVWWLADRRPGEPAGQPHWQARISHANHVGLNLVILLLCGSGIGLVLSSGAGPAILSGDGPSLPIFAHFPAMRAHFSAGLLLVALLSLHVGAACYHQFVRRDRLLSRMRVGAQRDAAS